MSTGAPVPAPRAEFERHLQTVFGALIVAGILWVGSEVTASTAEIARLQVHVAALRTEVSDLKRRIGELERLAYRRARPPGTT